jgi:DNA mismatch repair protein MutS2
LCGVSGRGAPKRPAGRERALQRPLSDNPNLVEQRLRETDDAVRLLQREPPPPMRLREVRPLIQRAAIGGILQPDELLQLLTLMQTARQYKEHLLPRAERYPALAPYAQRLHTFSSLERTLRDCIAPSGELTGHRQRATCPTATRPTATANAHHRASAGTDSPLARPAARADLYPARWAILLAPA